MTYTQLRTNIIAWIAESTAVPVIRANQSTPRPNPPYISVNITSMTPFGLPTYSLATAAGDQTITQDLSLSLSIQGYGYTAIDELQKVRSYTTTQAGEESLNDKSLVFLSDTGIRENSVVLDTTTEERYLYEINMGTSIQEIENTSYIENTDVTDNILKEGVL